MYGKRCVSYETLMRVLAHVTMNYGQSTTTPLMCDSGGQKFNHIIA